MFFLGKESIDELVRSCEGAIELEHKPRSGAPAARPRERFRGPEARIYEFSERHEPPSMEQMQERLRRHAEAARDRAAGKGPGSPTVTSRIASPVAVESGSTKGLSTSPITAASEPEVWSPAVAPLSRFSPRAEKGPPSVVSTKSALASFVQADGDGQEADEPEGDDALGLTVYLPDTSPVQVKVPVSSSAEEVIARTLRKLVKEGDSDKVSSTDASDYELRMHDSDGEPEDFAIERTAQISDLGDDEFCIYFIGGAKTSPTPGMTAASQPKGLVKVVLEHGQTNGDRPDHTILKIEEDWKVCDLLLEIARRRKELRLLSEQQYELKLDEDDMDRHHFWSEGSREPDGVLPLQTELWDLDVQTLHLHRKKFEDGGLLRVNNAAMRRYAGNQRSGDGNLAMDVDQEALKNYYLRYTDIQARQWEEWQVMKITPSGKAQRRRMGIGRKRMANGKDEYIITNDKMDNSARFMNVKNAKREIEKITGVRMDPNDRDAVEITFDEEGEDYVLKYKPYTTEYRSKKKEKKYSNEEAVRIACKILCLIDILKPERTRYTGRGRVQSSLASPMSSA